MLASLNGYQKDNLSSMVVDYVKEMILTGQFREGDHIPEATVADKLGISRAPVREGIKELEKEGIVTVIPRKGTFVTSYTLEDIKEVFDIRLLLENNIIEILIEEDKLTDQDFNILEGIVDDMMDIVNGLEDLATKVLLLNIKDMEFHRYIWQKSGSRRRVAILEDLFFQLRMAMLYDTNETGDLQVTARDHYEIIKHLRNKDVDKSKKALREHIVSYKEGRI